MSKLLGAALRQARQSKKLTQDNVAKHMGVTRSAVGQWEGGDTAPSTVNLMKLCAYLEIEVSAALVGLVQKDPDAHWPPRKSASPMWMADFEKMFATAGKDNVNIYKTSAGGPADFRFHHEHVGSVTRPAGLANTIGAAALYVVGLSMAPRFNEGDLVFFNGGRTPSLNDYVLITLFSEIDEWNACYLRQILGRDDKYITVRQINPDKTSKLDISKIETIDRIYPWNEIIIG